MRIIVHMFPRIIIAATFAVFLALNIGRVPFPH